jgi:uncharacterized repeat protein (TIGR01451 family)
LVFSFYQKEDKIMKKLLYSILIVALALVVVLPTAVLACTPNIHIEKYTLGCDGNYGDGVNVIAGNQVTWKYEVTNIGTSDSLFRNVVVTDSVAGVSPAYVSGDTDGDSKLDPGETWIYQATGTAISGNYSNTGTASGDGNNGFSDTDSDTSSYFGGAPGIQIVKTTNGNNETVAPGHYIPIGNTVTWTYTVTNTGNVALSAIVVTDNIAGVTPAYVSGDTHNIGKLDTDETWIFTASGNAVAGQYHNTGTAKGKWACQEVNNTDDSWYFGEIPSNPGINIVKYTNNLDVTGAPGPTIAVGDPVTWKYVVTNTGNVALSTVTVTDNIAGVSPVYVSGDTDTDNYLDLTETWIFTASGTATAGQYNNTGKAEGKPPTGSNVTATDDSWYYGATPGTPPTTPPEVGGDIYRTDKMALLIPIIALAFALLSGAFILVRRHQTQK